MRGTNGSNTETTDVASSSQGARGPDLSEDVKAELEELSQQEEARLGKEYAALQEEEEKLRDYLAHYPSAIHLDSEWGSLHARYSSLLDESRKLLGDRNRLCQDIETQKMPQGFLKRLEIAERTLREDASGAKIAWVSLAVLRADPLFSFYLKQKEDVSGLVQKFNELEKKHIEALRGFLKEKDGSKIEEKLTGVLDRVGNNYPGLCLNAQAYIINHLIRVARSFSENEASYVIEIEAALNSIRRNFRGAFAGISDESKVWTHDREIDFNKPSRSQGDMDLIAEHIKNFNDSTKGEIKDPAGRAALYTEPGDYLVEQLKNKVLKEIMIRKKLAFKDGVSKVDFAKLNDLFGSHFSNASVGIVQRYLEKTIETAHFSQLVDEDFANIHLENRQVYYRLDVSQPALRKILEGHRIFDPVTGVSTRATVKSINSELSKKSDWPDKKKQQICDDIARIRGNVAVTPAEEAILFQQVAATAAGQITVPEQPVAPQNGAATDFAEQQAASSSPSSGPSSSQPSRFQKVRNFFGRHDGHFWEGLPTEPQQGILEAVAKGWETLAVMYEGIVFGGEKREIKRQSYKEKRDRKEKSIIERLKKLAKDGSAPARERLQALADEGLTRAGEAVAALMAPAASDSAPASPAAHPGEAAPVQVNVPLMGKGLLEELGKQTIYEYYGAGPDGKAAGDKIVGVTLEGQNDEKPNVLKSTSKEHPGTIKQQVESDGTSKTIFEGFTAKANATATVTNPNLVAALLYMKGRAGKYTASLEEASAARLQFLLEGEYVNELKQAGYDLEWYHASANCIEIVGLAKKPPAAASASPLGSGMPSASSAPAVVASLTSPASVSAKPPVPPASVVVSPSVSSAPAVVSSLTSPAQAVAAALPTTNNTRASALPPPTKTVVGKPGGAPNNAVPAAASPSALPAVPAKSPPTPTSAKTVVGKPGGAPHNAVPAPKAASAKPPVLPQAVTPTSSTALNPSVSNMTYAAAVKKPAVRAAAVPLPHNRQQPNASVVAPATSPKLATVVSGRPGSLNRTILQTGDPSSSQGRKGQSPQNDMVRFHKEVRGNSLFKRQQEEVDNQGGPTQRADTPGAGDVSNR